MVALRFAARSDIGHGRYKNNQDSGYAGPHLLVVADGMGGHAGGDVASSIAVGELSRLDGESHGPEAVAQLEAAIRRARELIQDRADDEQELAGMGTTVTALLRSGRKLVLAHIGDSRAYLLHDGELTQVTRDHTFVQSLLDAGRITAEEAERHPQRSVITRVLGDVDASSEVDTSVREATVGDRWLLCSDGLSGVVSADTLAETLRVVEDPAACAERLVELALRAGGPDNITCVVADVVDDTQTPDAVPVVVGAAAGRAGPGAVPQDSPAARAAALTATPGDRGTEHGEDGEDGPPPEHGGRRRVLRALVTLGVVAVLVAGGWAAYGWSQQQFYVGTAGTDVAIYRGLTQDVGPLSLSAVHERQDLPVDTLPRVWQDRVTDGITAEDLPDAERIVADLRLRSDLCTPVPVTPSPAPSPTPTTGTTPAPGSSAPDAPSPTSGLTPAPAPSPTATLPPGCEVGD